MVKPMEEDLKDAAALGGVRAGPQQVAEDRVLAGPAELALEHTYDVMHRDSVPRAVPSAVSFRR